MMVNSLQYKGEIVNDTNYRALLDLIMCSDPWPVEGENQQIIESMANEEAKRRGFDTWVDAYHQMEKP